MLFDRFDLWPEHAAYGWVWRGWRVMHTGTVYIEHPVILDDLTLLPVGADVRIAGERWRREAA